MMMTNKCSTVYYIYKSRDFETAASWLTILRAVVEVMHIIYTVDVAYVGLRCCTVVLVGCCDMFVKYNK